MPADSDAAALIDAIVSRSRVAGRRRDDLRRELWTHFEEVAAADGPGVPTAIDRFGSVDAVADAMGRVYRGAYRRRCALQLVVTAGATVAAALLIELLMNVRAGSTAAAVRVAPGFSRGVGTAIALALGLLAAREGARPPLRLGRVAGVAGFAVVVWIATGLALGSAPIATLSAILGAGALCWRIDAWAPRTLCLAASFATIVYVDHLAISVHLGAVRALAAGLTLAAVWSSALVIMRGADRLFDSPFDATSPSA